MNKELMNRLGITPVQKLRNIHNAEDDQITVNIHKDGAASIGYTKAVAELIIGGDIHEKYIQFGTTPNMDRLYMWGDDRGFSVCENKASTSRCYTQSKSLAAVLPTPEEGYPYKRKLMFDKECRCYYITILRGDK